VNIAGISGTWTDQTTSNGLKFVTDPDSGDLDFQGGVGSAGVSTRRPLVMGTFLDIPSRTVQIITGVASDGSAVETSNDPKIAQGLKQASLISSRTNNLSISAATLTSTGGAVLGAAVVSSPDDVVTLTKASYGAVDASGNALPDQTIPDLSTGAPVPEPTALGLAGVAVVGLARRRRKA
jgi:MYXO-CTERM domain-containing protein